MRKVVLSPFEKEKLSHLQQYSHNSVERKRSLILLLSNQGNSMNKVSQMVAVNYTTVFRLLNAWESASPENRFSVLKNAEGQGAKIKLQSIEHELPKLLEENDRNLNFVLQEIEKRFAITVCKLTLQNFLKANRL